MRLTDTRIKALKPRPHAQLIGDGRGLYVRVYPSGTKVWCLRDSSGYRQKLKTLGRYPDMTLKEARRAAAGDTRTVAILFSKSTVGELVQAFYSVIEQQRKDPLAVRLYLDRDLSRLGNKKVVDVTRADLAALLRIRAAAGTPVAANRLLAIIRQLFRFAVRSGALDADPSALLDRSLAGGKEKARERVLSDDEIRALWHVETEHQPLFRWLLLSGQRIGEAQAACWRDIRDGKWHIPQNKADRPHWCAVSSLMRDVLATLPQGKPEDRVFRQVTKTGVQVWLRRWCQREQIKPAFTPHDLRRTFSTRANEVGVPPHVVERILNHKMMGVMAIYNRASYERERIEGQQLWAKSLSELTGHARRSPKRK